MELVEAFSCQLSSLSEELEKLICEFSKSVLVYPTRKGSVGGVGVACFLTAHSIQWTSKGFIHQ